MDTPDDFVPAGSATPDDFVPATAAPKKSWAMTAAEFAVPAVTDTLGALGGEAVEPIGGGIAGAAAGNLAADYILNGIRREAGYPEEKINPLWSLGTGAVGEGVGRYVVPAAGAGLKAAGRFMIGAPAKEAIEAGGQAAVDAAAAATEKAAGGLETAAKPVAEQQAAQQIGQSMGVDPGRLTSPERTSQDVYQESIRHRETQMGVLKPVGRLFKKEGEKIGHILDQYSDTDAVTTALAGLKDPNSIGGRMTEYNMHVSPATQQLLDDAVAVGNSGTDKVGKLLGSYRDIVQRLDAAKNPDDQYVLGQLRDQYHDLLTDNDNLPAEAQRALYPLNQRYATMKDRIGDAFKIGRTSSPAETADELFKRDPVAVRDIVNEATPDELSRLREGAAAHILGDGNLSSDKIIERFNNLSRQHPEALKKIFGDSEFLEGKTWGDMPRVLKSVNENIRDPNLKGNLADGWAQAQATPEGKAFQDQLAKFRALPEPEQQRLSGMHEAFREQGKMRDMMSGQKYWLMRQLVFAPFGVGMLAHHRVAGAIAGGVWASRAATAKLVRDNPVAYLKFLRYAASPTAQGLKKAGYYMGKATMYDLANQLRDLMNPPQPK